jgi:hypothetical protein
MHRYLSTLCGEAGKESQLQRVFLKHHENLLEISAVSANDYSFGFRNSNRSDCGYSFTATEPQPNCDSGRSKHLQR